MKIGISEVINALMASDCYRLTAVWTVQAFMTSAVREDGIDWCDADLARDECVIVGAQDGFNIVASSLNASNEATRGFIRDWKMLELLKPLY